jgi:hypothetical protein
LKRVNSLAMSVMNAVNCANAPSNCTALNRSPCSARAQTCGPCLPGSYLGEEGDSNEPCHFFDGTRVFNTSSSQSNLWRETSLGPCEHNDDCPVWYVCEKGTCTLPRKECLHSCYGRGACLYLDADGVLLANNYPCYAGDAFCSAVCDCYEGYDGDTCSMTSSEQEKRASARDMAVSNLA